MNQPKNQPKNKPNIRWQRILTVLIAIACSLGVSMNRVGAIEPSIISQISTGSSPTSPTSSSAPYTTVDVVPKRHQMGKTLYLKNCTSCHIGIPPQSFPSETWLNVIQDESHYGTTINPPLDPSRGLIWAYLRNGSRQKSVREERSPYRLQQSQYFKALHPRVDLPRPVTLNTCVTCHPGAPQFNFRQLTPEWIDAS